MLPSITQIFIETLRDLEAKLNSPTDYNIIKASGLLRQLFLDGRNSTAVQVNRHFRLKLEFRVLGRGERQIPDILKNSFIFWEDPYPKDGIPSRFVSMDQFLSLDILYSRGMRFTVKNLIKVSANILGGVHRVESGMDESERILIQLGESFWINQRSPLILHINSIGRIALDSLNPLREKIESGEK